MGIFDFVKKVGNKLGIGDDEPSAEALKKELDSNKLGTENVAVKVDGEKVVLSGVVVDQAAFEKAIIAVGNTIGVSKVDADELKVAPPEAVKAAPTIDITELIKQAIPAASPKFYTVKKGDNLSKIAEAQYGKGNASKHKAIFEANKPMLKHPDKIYPGQVLRIPDISETTAKA